MRSPVPYSLFPVPSKHRSLFALLLSAAGLAAVFVALSAAQGDDAPPRLADPVPLRRVWLTPDRVPREMERQRQGVLVQLSREEFEERVRQAALADAAVKNPPRLVEARYHAALNEGALVGSCQWKVVHTAPAPGLLPLKPLTLALRQPRYENRDALIADFDGHDPSLLVETAGDQSVAVEWSARGEARPDELQFDLKFPPCPVAVLELDLPADREAFADGAVLSGPFPAEAADRRLWKVACGGRSQVALQVRPVPGAGQSPLLLARQQTTQTLSPDGVEAAFAFNLKALHQRVRELAFECDGELRPYDVVAPTLEGWAVQPGKPGGPFLLTVRLKEALEEGTVEIRCLAPLSTAAPAGAATEPRPVRWTSPGVRLPRALTQGETLTLQMHPDLCVEDWEPGAFRLTATATVPDPERRVDGRRLTLIGGGLAAAAPPAGTAVARPAARLRVHDVDFRARQLAWWRIDPADSSLTLQIRYDVSQGRLFQLPVQLPAEWEVDRVDLSPPGLLRDWGVKKDKGRDVLLVDLQRPLPPADKTDGWHGQLAARGTPTLTVRLKPAANGHVSGKELAFPDAAPLGARFREGGLAIGYDDRTYRLDVQTAAAEAPAEEEGPWDKEIPEYYYPYRDQSAEGRPPLQGTATLRPRPPRVRAHCTTDVFLRAVGAGEVTRLVLEAERGSPESVDVYLSAAGAGLGDWADEQGRPAFQRVERLDGADATAAVAALAAGDPLGVAALTAALPRGESWRLTFARPLRPREPLVLRCKRALAPDGDRWRAPLLAVPAASRMEGEVTLHLDGANPLQVEAVGLREASAAHARDRGASAWRTFRYGNAAIALTLVGQVVAPDRSAEAVIDRARLTTYVYPDGLLEHHYGFQASHWQGLGRSLPLRLPAEAQAAAFQVDGVWSPRVTASRDKDGRQVLALPLPNRTTAEEGTTHRYEVVYTTRAAGGWLWTRVEAPAPSPPVVAAVPLQRVWRLPPDLLPLSDAGFRRLPGPGEGGAAADRPALPADFLHPGSLNPWPRDDPGQREALANALKIFRARGDQTLSLREAVEQMDDLLKDHGKFAIDVTALREAGVDPDATLTLHPAAPDEDPEPWKQLGLTAVTTRSGPLLTTERQCGAWRETSGSAAPPEAVENAVREAATRGRDDSRRFLSAACWDEAVADDGRGLPSPAGALESWTEWEPLPGADAGDGLTTVRRPTVSLLGFALAVAAALLLGAVGWRLKRLRLGLLLVWLALAGAGVSQLPTGLQGLAWPALISGGVVALAWFLVWAVFHRAAPKAGVKAAAAAAGATAALLLLSLVGWHGQLAARAAPADAAPAPVAVYIAPGPADAPEKQIVLAPPDLLDQLQALARPGGGPGAVLLGAAYDGKIVDGKAQFDALLQAYCLTDEPTTLAVPLDGVQLLDDVWLDGARAQAAPLPAPQAGFALKVNGRGPHKVELHFRTEVTGTAEERNVQFTAPRLVQSKLTLQVPKGAASPQALVKHGAQHVTPGPDGLRLDVELGRIAAPAHLRWYAESWLAQPADVEFKEAYLWDLRIDGSGLTAFLAYTVARGAVTTLAIDLPPELEVRAVEARRPRDGGPVRLREWKASGSGPARLLQLDFSAPVTGEIEVVLDLAPRGPLPPTLVLPLPAPRGRRVREQGGYLAYRTRGLDVQRVNPLGVTGVNPADFAPFWPGRPDPATLAYACALPRERDNPPVLGLKIQAAAPATQAAVDVTVRVGRRQADVRAAAELTAPDGDLALVEWKVDSAQPFLVTAVTGADVRRWNQAGDRLLVWLERPKETAKEKTKLEVVGWLPLTAAADASRLDLPCLRVLSAQTQQTGVRLTAAGELALTGVEVRNLTPVPSAKPSDQERTFTTTRADYGGTCQVRSGTPTYQVVTIAEVRDRRLTFTSVVDYRPPVGEARALNVRVRGWEGADVRVTAPRSVRLGERRRGPGERLWTMELEPGVSGPYRFTITGGMAVEDAAAGAALPEVSVPGAVWQEGWAGAGADLTAEASGLTPVADPAAALAAWNLGPAGEALRGASARLWKVASPEWRLRLSPHDSATEQAPIRVFLADYTAGVAGGRRWLHEAVFWLRHDANADLNLTWPLDAEVLAVDVDGAEIAPLQPEARRLWLPLTGRPAVCRVRVRWRYEESAEGLDRPCLEQPRLEGAGDAPAVWTVYAPPGRKRDPAAKDAALRPGLAAAAALELHRAEAQLHIAKDLMARGGPAEAAESPAAAQRRFRQACRRAELALDAAPDGATAPAPDGRTLAEWLSDLKDQNTKLTPPNGPSAPGADARLDAEGEPLYGWAPAGREAPAPVFLSSEDPSVQRAWPATAAWLVFLALAAVASFSPWLLGWGRFFWPELLAAFAGMTLLLAGPERSVLWFALVLLLLAAAGRLLLLGRGLAWLFRRPPPAPKPAPKPAASSGALPTT